MADIFNKINFNPASGQTLREAFDTIDENFSRIGGTSLLRGEDGTDWDAEVVDWDANRDMPEWAGFADAVLSAVYGNDVPTGGNGDAARKSIPREVTVMRSDWEILLTPTCVADYKYSVAEGTNAAWSGEDDKSCVVSGLYDIKNGSWRMITAGSIMPRIYCDSGGDAYWMFGQYKTSIRANGVPGPAGEGDRILVARGEPTVIDGVRGVIVRKIWDASAGDNRFVDISESNSEIVPRAGTWAYAFAIDESATPESAVTDVFMGPIDTKEVDGEIVYFVGYDAAQSIGTLVGQFSLKRALMETGREDEAEGADALPFLFLNCGTLDKTGAWRGTGSWRFIPSYDKASGRDTLTVEHSSAPVTNDSYTEEDAEYKATGADMRITGVDGIYKECTFEPIYKKNDDLGGDLVFNDCAKFINDNINKYISETDKTTIKSDTALSAEVDKAYYENIYELLLSQQKDTTIIGSYTNRPLAKFSCLKDIGDDGDGQIVQTSHETVNRDMIEALLSVIRPTGQLRVPFWDKVVTAASASNYDKFGIEQITPLDIMVINKVLYNLLFAVYGITESRYLFDDHSADEKLKYLNDKGNKFSSVLDSIKRGLYIPVGATISLPREYVSLDPNIPDNFGPLTDEDTLLKSKSAFESEDNIYFQGDKLDFWWELLTGGDPEKSAWNNGIIHPYDLRYWAVRQFVIKGDKITDEDRKFTFFEKDWNGELQCKTITVLNPSSDTLQPNVREWQDHTLMFTYKDITGIGTSWIMEYNGMTFRIFPTDSRFDGDGNTHRYTMPFITSPASKALQEGGHRYNSMFSEATGIITGTTHTVDDGPTIHSGRGTMEGSFKMDKGTVVAFQGMPFVVVQRIL